MNRIRVDAFLFALIFMTACSAASAQDRTVGTVLNTGEAFEGYTLFGPLMSKSVYLIDMDGRLVNQWDTEYPAGAAVYLLDNGDLLRAGNVGGSTGDFGAIAGSGGIIQRFSWDGQLLWQYRYADDTVRQHHDFVPLPNGNILLVAWKLVDRDRALALGRDTSLLRFGELWADRLVEVRPIGSDSGEIVWVWNTTDHLVQDRDPELPGYGVVADHPELIDVNYNNGRNNFDWFHTNGIDYNAELDQILISVPSFDEIWVIDHSTTAEEAVGHSGGNRGRGGDLLYRWGNPKTYGAGTEENRQLYFQHNPHWIPAGYPGGGDILIFNNGQNRPDGNYSTADEIQPPLNGDGGYDFESGTAFGPEGPVWRYRAENPSDFFSANISSAQRLPNGNTFICEGATGRFFEVTSDGAKVWEYINPANANGTTLQGTTPKGNNVFRAERFAPDFPGFQGRDRTPGPYLERYESAVEGGTAESATVGAFTVEPNPVAGRAEVRIELGKACRLTVVVFDAAGREVQRPVDGEDYSAGIVDLDLNVDGLVPGRYFLTYGTTTGSHGRIPLVVF